MKKRILIVEDQKEIQDLLKSILIRIGFETEVLSEGESLLSRRSNFPDLFILDVQLPGINGLELCEWLKSQSMTKDIPVIIVSGIPGLASLAKQVGADDIISKPFEIQELLKTINEQLREK